MSTMRKLRARAVPAVLACVFLVPSAASAATDPSPVSAEGAAATAVGSGTGGDIYTGPSIPMTAVERQHLAEMYAAYLSQTGPKAISADAVRADAARFGVAAELSSEVAAQSRTATMSAAASSANLSILLNVTQQPQTKGYYCGPAAGAEIIKAPLFASMKSKADGASISQTAMANSKHMKTDANGLTAWASKNFVTGLNAWTGNTKHVYAQVTAPSATTMVAALTTVMVGGAPVAADTVEFENGAHYNNHPNRTIGHWIVTYYYGNYGATVGFVDSTANSTAVSGFGSAQPKFQVDTATFTTTFLKSNGIVY